MIKTQEEILSSIIERLEAAKILESGYGITLYNDGIDCAIRIVKGGRRKIMATPTGHGFTEEEMEELGKQRSFEELDTLLPRLDPFYDDAEDDSVLIPEKAVKEKMNIFLRNIIDCLPSIQWRIREWRNLPEIRKWTWTQHIISVEEHQAWLKNLKTDESQLWFVIYADNEPVGVVGAKGIDVYHRVVREEALYMSPEAGGKGIATKAQKMFFDTMFNNYPIDKIGGEFMDGNIIKYVHVKTGYEKEGQLKNHAILDGETVDVIVVGLTRRRWEWLKTNKDIGEDLALRVAF